MQTAIPESLRYSKGLKMLGPGHTVGVRKYFPESGISNFNTSNRVIRIPISAPNGFMDTNRSAINCKVSPVLTGGNASAAGNVFFDNSAYSLIDTLRILDSNGTVLEEIQNYGIIMNRLMDANLPYTKRTKEGTYAGFNKSTGSADPFAGTNQISLCSYTAASPAVVTNSSTYLSIPLVGSGVLNMTSEAHAGGLLMPLALIQGIVIEIQLVANAFEAFSLTGDLATPALSFTVDNVSFDATIIEFDQSLIAQMKQQIAASGGSVFVSSYTYHGQTTSQASASLTLQMNERAKSIKSIFAIPRLTSQTTNAFQNITASPAPTNNGTVNAYLLIGSKQFPNQPYNYYHECFKAFKDACGGGLDGIIDAQVYESNAVTMGATQGRFTLGWDLEAVHARDLIEAGVDNSTSSIPISVNFTYNDATAKTIVLASHVDMIIQVDILNRTVRTSY